MTDVQTHSTENLVERPRDTWRTDPALRRTRTLVLSEGDPEVKREEIRRYYHATCDIEESLMEQLAYDETFYLRADELRHPLIFYYGHTAVFYINKLIIAGLIDRRINPTFESMFAVGVDEMSWDDLDMSHYDWPAVAEVETYRDTVRQTVDELIRTLPLEMPIDWDNPWWVFLMGIEHARIHLETSSVLIRQLPVEHVRPHPLWQPCRQHGPAPENQLITVPGSTVVMGKPKDHPLYGWDNEFGHYEEKVPSFEAGKHLVTNGEFLAFVDDPDGYLNQRWWTEEGWAWRGYEEAEHPRFWIKDGATWRLRLVAEEVDMPWDWPVEVNYLEAKAFCNWKAHHTGQPVRMPTEVEWTRLRDHTLTTDQPYWDEAPGNINLEHYASSCPVTEFAFDEFTDVIGNAWQWTETAITGFPGFDIHPYYDDFSTPTFDTRHNLMKGGSWISTGNEATRDSRYAFRRHFYQHAGFRYVITDRPVQEPADVYESDPAVAQYCEGHYGDEYFGVPNFPKRLAELCIEAMDERPRHKALDLGCAVGRSTFELARAFDEVTGLDFSARFIRLGVELRERGAVRWVRTLEGHLESFREATLEELDLEGLEEKVNFQQADACNLKPIYTGYNLVLAANLIDRLYDPRKFLSMIHQRIVPGGLLVISSPYTWSTEFTEKDLWLGGLRVDGEPKRGLEGLHDVLDEHFTRVGTPLDVPFVLRETARKFQHTISEVTVWERG